MKRYLSLVLAALMLVACLSLTACDLLSKKPAIPEGYKEYNNGEISFAYPDDWKMTDGSTVILVNSTGVGNNITVVYEAKNTVYDTITVEEFEAQMKPAYQAMGMSIKDTAIEQTKNECGTQMTKISLTTTSAAAKVTMTQTMYITHVGDRTYTVTVTEVSNDDALVDTVFNTLYKEKK